MEPIEHNIIHSFKRAKTDMLKMQNTISSLSLAQERMMEMFSDLQNKEAYLYKRINDIKKVQPTVVQAKRTKKKYIASVTGKNVHVTNCPFAKNIKPKSKVIFASKNKALNSGYKACDCIKKI